MWRKRAGVDGVSVQGAFDTLDEIAAYFGRWFNYTNLLNDDPKAVARVLREEASKL